MKKPTATGNVGNVLGNASEKSSATGQTVAQALKRRGASNGAPPALPPGVESPGAAALQLKAYETAIAIFAQSRLIEARQHFLEATRGPAPHIADKARSYIQVCDRRTATFDLKLNTAEDHFTYGVERLNARDVVCAKDHLGRALRLDPHADHVLYTLALCCGLDGDGDGACENLKRAIELEPRNRILARQDPEFAALASQIPALRSLLAGD